MEANKPVLLTVDDDPGVSRAVARDLRRRYGQDYRYYAYGHKGSEATPKTWRDRLPWASRNGQKRRSKVKDTPQT